MNFPDPLSELTYLTGKLTSLLLEQGAALNGEHQIAYMGTQGAKTIRLYVGSDMLEMEIMDGNDTGLTAYSEIYDEG